MVTVPADRPTVPDRAGTSGALVVLGTGTWTAGELTGLTDACTDAGHEITGFVVATPVRARTARTTGPSARPTAPALGGAV